MWSGISNWSVNYVVNQAFSCDDEQLLEQDAAIHTYEIGNSSCYDGFVSANLYNTGSAPLTNATVELRRDGALLDTYDWTGELSSGAEAPVLFENIDLQPGLNNFSLRLASADDDLSNNEVAVPFFKSPETSLNFDLFIQSDSDAEDHANRWEIVDENGNVVASGALANSTYEELSLTLEAEGCYKMQIYDQEGDGFNEGGFLLLVDEFGTPAADITTFSGTKISAEFLALANVSNTRNAEAVPAWSVFPNPVKDIVRVQYVLDESGPVQIHCLNGTGQVLRTLEYTSLPAGTHEAEFDLETMPAGIYQIQIMTQNGRSARSVVR
jgi:hypothetical protein